MALNYLLCLTIIAYFSSTEGLIIGNRCHYDVDCFVEQSYCLRQEVCECKENFLPSSDLQFCIATVGAICSTRHDCSTLPNSVCIEENCRCDRGFVPDPHYASCKPVSTGLNGSCEFDAQCQSIMGDFAVCTRGQCYCLPNYHFLGKCIRSRNLGEACRNNTECHGNFTICSTDHRCICRPGYHPTSHGTCRSAGVSSAIDKLIITFLLMLAIYNKYLMSIT